MARETVSIDFKSKKVNINFVEFDKEIDVDELTTIDYNNIYAELITVPALMNRVGMWKAQVTNDMSIAKMQRDISIAEKSEYYRIKLKRMDTYANGKDKITFPTVAEIENAVTLDAVVINHRKRVIRMQKNVDYLDSLYWSVQSKNSKIEAISKGMQLSPEEFESNLIEQKINGVFIKIKEKLIK